MSGKSNNNNNNANSNNQNVKRRKENAKHIEAFNRYVELKLGDDFDIDVFQTIADEFNQKRQTIYQWSCNFNWKERFEKVEQEAKEKAHRKMVRRIANRSEKQMNFLLGYLPMVEQRMVEMLANGASVRTSDYIELIKLYTLLIGGVTERTENTNVNKEEIGEKEMEMITDLAETIKASMLGDCKKQ